MSLPSEYPHAPHRQSKKVGEDYQEFVRRCVNPYGITYWNWTDRQQQLALGENPQGWEIKLDSRCFSREPANRPTGRLSIEVQEKSSRDMGYWTNSGILRDDNAWIYVQGNYEIIFVFSKNWLLRFYYEKITQDDVEQHNGTVRKFYLPIRSALLGASLVLEVTDRAKCRTQPLRKDEKGQWRI